MDRKALFDQVVAWRRSQEVRAYLGAVRKAANDRWGSIDAGSELDEWLRWAETVADSIDPLCPKTRGQS